ncbi:MAG: hypothetical protein H6882_04500 [Rhodobiaceae bacterium]|nr:hypothetical protein [Rhodobiaceae bacterium]
MPAGELVYIRLERRRASEATSGVASSAKQCNLPKGAGKFLRIVRAYDDARPAYRPRVSAMLARAEESYDHLSRYREWSTADGGSGDGE